MAALAALASSGASERQAPDRGGLAELCRSGDEPLASSGASERQAPDRGGLAELCRSYPHAHSLRAAWWPCAGGPMDNCCVPLLGALTGSAGYRPAGPVRARLGEPRRCPRAPGACRREGHRRARAGKPAQPPRRANRGRRGWLARVAELSPSGTLGAGVRRSLT